MNKAVIIYALLCTLAFCFPYQYGWPQMITGGVDFSSPVLVDVNSDDTLEILIAGNDRWVYLFNHRGENMPGWPQSTSNSPGPRESSSPAVGDIDNDGAMEIVFASNAGSLFAWELNGDTVSGFPVNLGDPVIRACAALEQIDLDPELEICIGTGTSQYRIIVFNHDGSQLFSRDVEFRIHSTAAIGDIDKDNYMEIVHGVDRNMQYGIYAWESNGDTCTGWPKTTGHHVDGSPALADIDGDSLYEVFVGSIDNRVYGLNYIGQDLPSWPNVVGSGIYEGIVSSPAIGDLNNDSILDIVIGRGIIQSSYGAVFAFRSFGDTMPGFPINISTGAITSSPMLADLDGDADIEIVVGCQDGFLYAFNPDTTTVTGFPIPVAISITSSPAIGDIDLDGDIELVVGGFAGTGNNDSLYVWDLPVVYNASRLHWPQFHRDPQHTGRYPLGSSMSVNQNQFNLAQKLNNYANIICGPLALAPGHKYRIFDIIGKEVDINNLECGVYFIEIDGRIAKKLIKLR